MWYAKKTVESARRTDARARSRTRRRRAADGGDAGGGDGDDDGVFVFRLFGVEVGVDVEARMVVPRRIGRGRSAARPPPRASTESEGEAEDDETAKRVDAASAVLDAIIRETVQGIFVEEAATEVLNEARGRSTEDARRRRWISARCFDRWCSRISRSWMDRF